MENYDDVLKEIKEDNKEEFFVCPYCDNRYKNSLDKCPHCGAKRL
jgi:rubrerythrin